MLSTLALLSSTLFVVNAQQFTGAGVNKDGLFAGKLFVHIIRVFTPYILMI
jgi:hypothetical protein